MTLQLLEPSSIQISGKLPKKIFRSHVYYLGYGRNAWHYTWINRYFKNCISFETQELKNLAEKRRVQGSVFKVESLPLVIVQYEINSFGFCAINDKSQSDYDALIEKIISDEPQNFWKYFPSSSRNWILILFFGERELDPQIFEPGCQKSHSNGGNFRLSWMAQTASRYERFQDFSSKIITHLGAKGVP